MRLHAYNAMGKKLSQSDHCEASYGLKNEIIVAFFEL